MFARKTFPTTLDVFCCIQAGGYYIKEMKLQKGKSDCTESNQKCHWTQWACDSTCSLRVLQISNMNLEKTDRYWKITGSKLSHDILESPCPNTIVILPWFAWQKCWEGPDKIKGSFCHHTVVFFLSIIIFSKGFLNLRKPNNKSMVERVAHYQWTNAGVPERLHKLFAVPLRPEYRTNSSVEQCSFYSGSSVHKNL